MTLKVLPLPRERFTNDTPELIELGSLLIYLCDYCFLTLTEISIIFHSERHNEKACKSRKFISREKQTDRLRKHDKHLMFVE